MVAALLAAGLAVDARSASSGGTPLHLAASNGHTECVKYLFHQAYARNRSINVLNAVDRWGNMAHTDARRECYPEILKFLSDKVMAQQQPRHGGAGVTAFSTFLEPFD